MQFGSGPNGSLTVGRKPSDDGRTRPVLRTEKRGCIRSEAMLALKAARTVLRQSERTIEDIMSEIDTGKALVNGRDRPLLDAINAMQPAPAPAPAPPSIEKFEWTSTDLEFVFNAACYIDGRDPEGVWFSIKQTGCDDRKILEILRAIWPMTAQFRPAPPPGCTIRGGTIPSFWIGETRPPRRIPTLAGLELADRIRRVLEIPRVQVSQDHVLSGVLSGKPRKMTRRSRKENDHESPSTA